MYTGYRDCCSHYHGCMPAYYVPVIWVQVPDACCDTITVPRDIDVDTENSSRQALVGGSSQASLSVEYLVETGAEAASVNVTATLDGVDTTWSDSAPAGGYHVQEAVMSVKPGTKVSIKVNNVTARLRWCERICC